MGNIGKEEMEDDMEEEEMVGENEGDMGFANDGRKKRSVFTHTLELFPSLGITDFMNCPSLMSQKGVAGGGWQGTMRGGGKTRLSFMEKAQGAGL
ncbi:hypothetical protein SAY86_028177 [Trapa natans]|uniref:Uncharacterized protein n=1 Tax=Trapa natans TaxID=22666 RepID=A0AAN7LYW0_TRANT|nr:hypothetical protein SAY86_028177 [Trapa natans]